MLWAHNNSCNQGIRHFCSTCYEITALEQACLPPVLFRKQSKKMFVKYCYIPQGK